MALLGAAKSCELHVHIGGCLYAEDVLRLAAGLQLKIDWQLFVSSYTEAFGSRPDPVGLIDEALAGSVDPWRRHFVVDAGDKGDFARFQAKFNLTICVLRHLAALNRYDDALDLILDRHRSEGLQYVEYRSMFMRGTADPEGFLNMHRRNARRILTACGSGFQARYIPSLPRDRPLESYALIRRLLRESPELIPTIVGLDFCFFEEGHPPRSTRPFFEHLRRDDEENPEQSLAVVYHVGEVFFDKSLESSVRWCHEAALLGSRRLGHATALGMDPAVAVGRRSGAHYAEPIGERLDQIDYDLEHADGLAAAGIRIDVGALEGERQGLRAAAVDDLVHREYTPERLEEVRKRQDYVLGQLTAMGTVIESCPTSNLLIGAVPDPASHPVHRFLASDVNLAIGADDPGTFASPLAAEVDWVLQHSGLTEHQLDARLGDPRRFALRSVSEYSL
jgi:hypothetical protein